MELTHQYYDERISDIPKQYVRQLINEKLKQMIFDFGQKLATKADEEAVTHLIQRTYEILTQKHRYWTWGDVISALERGKVGQYGGVASSKITVQKVQSWLYHYSEDRARQKNQEKKDIPPPVDKSQMAPPEYGAALEWKSKHLSGYPELWEYYTLSRVREHVRAGTIKELTEQVNIEKENYAPVNNFFTKRSNRRSANQPANR